MIRTHKCGRHGLDVSCSVDRNEMRGRKGNPSSQMTRTMNAAQTKIRDEIFLDKQFKLNRNIEALRIRDTANRTSAS
jgi:hypothetical protein